LRLFKQVQLRFMIFFILMMGFVGIQFSIAENFHMEINKSCHGFDDNDITVYSPEAGILTINFSDDLTLYRSIELSVDEGINHITWDGLGWNEEPLVKKDYKVSAILKAYSGLTYENECNIQLESNLQHILYALPSCDHVYLKNTDDWFIEFEVMRSDELIIDIYHQENDNFVGRFSKEVNGRAVYKWTFNSSIKKILTKEGLYNLRIYGKSRPEEYITVPLKVLEGSQTDLTVDITGDLMPERNASDAEIWALMMKSSVVIDIKNTSHQPVYESPDKSSQILGYLHGQSQCVSVMDIQSGWAEIRAWEHEFASQITGWVPYSVLKVVSPQTEYGLLVDKKSQKLKVFHSGKVIDILQVSTGHMKLNETKQETAAGIFLTDEHMSDYSTNGLKYDFVIRYDGGNLLHQIPYEWSMSGKKDLRIGEQYLGTKASHACIRVQAKPAENGINAYWLWTHLPFRTKIIILDDEEERTEAQILATQSTPELSVSLNENWIVVEEDEDDDKMTETAIAITFGGDVVLGGRENYYGIKEGFPAYIQNYGIDWPFSNLIDLFHRDDWTVVNLECVLKDDSTGEETTKLYRFRGKTEYVNILQQAGIEMVNIANNHTIDYGETGYLSTLNALDGNVRYCGNHYNEIIELQGHLFGFGGCRETNYYNDSSIIESDIRELKENGAEFVIYQCHWGTEYDENHNNLQEAMARACARAGADLVIGHHPHVVQGISWIDETAVVYSLGNLMFGGTIHLTTYDGLIVRALFYPERKSNRVELFLIPVLTSSKAREHINDYQPILADGEDALRILNLIQSDTPWSLSDRVEFNLP